MVGLGRRFSNFSGDGRTTISKRSSCLRLQAGKDSANGRLRPAKKGPPACSGLSSQPLRIESMSMTRRFTVTNIHTGLLWGSMTKQLPKTAALISPLQPAPIAGVLHNLHPRMQIF